MKRAALVLSAGVLAASAFTAAPPPASAEPLNTPVRTCTTGNCQATILYGRLNKSDRCCGFDNKPMPWVAQLYAAANECLRLNVTATNSPAVLTVLTPGVKRAFSNSATAPLLKIKTVTNEAGWFLVQVSQKTGTAVDATFTLAYARYAATNANCSTPSTPLPQ